jgi:copper/silver efflux system protein
MLQTGMRATMGLKIRAPDLQTLDRMAVETGADLAPGAGRCPAETVNADRVVGMPYLEIAIDRERVSRYGLNIADVQNVISVADRRQTITTHRRGPRTLSGAHPLSPRAAQ